MILHGCEFWSVIQREEHILCEVMVVVVVMRIAVLRGDTIWSGSLLESSWNVMVHGDAREGKWRGNWRVEWVASTLHTTLEHGVSSITTADAHTSAASSRLNWCPRRFKWTCPFCRKTKSGYCACAITFQTQSTNVTSTLKMKASSFCKTFIENIYYMLE